MRNYRISRIILSFSFCALLFIGIGMAAPPAWWNEKAVLTPGATANDFAAVNLGQVKSIVAKAVAEMNDRLPGGAGIDLNHMVATWSDPPATGTVRSDYAAINQGQLKSIAKLFYDRLAEVGYDGPPLVTGQTYPWTYDTGDDNSFAAVNIGQVKYLFSFDPSLVSSIDPTDTDGDGLPDEWEDQYGLDPLVANGSEDPDGDDLTNLEEYQSGTDPVDYFNGQLPTLTTLVSPDGTLGPGDTLSLLVTSAAAQPLPNAPVTFTATSGGHLLANTSDGVASVEVTVRTGSDGIATVYVKDGTN